MPMKIELYTPTIAREMPMKIKRWRGFSATNATPGSEARLHQTEHPNALPASERCPGQPRQGHRKFFRFYSRQFAFGHGCDHSSYVNPFRFVFT